MQRILLALLLVGMAGCVRGAAPQAVEPEAAAAAPNAGDAEGGASAGAAPLEVETTAAFAGEVAKFRIVNDTGAAPGPRVISFGQIFRHGQVRPSSRLTVTLGGVRSSYQMDAKAFYADGSVRHAVMSVRTGGLASNAAADGVVTATAATTAQAAGTDGSVGPPPPPPPTPTTSTPPLLATLTFRSGANNGKTFNIDLRTLHASGSPWLSGALVREQRYTATTIQGIQVVFDVWTPSVGPGRVDVVFHNDTAQNANIGLQIYDASLTLGGKQMLPVTRVRQHAYSTWHRMIYADGTPPPRMTPDTATLIAVGAVPHYAAIKPNAGEVLAFHKDAVASGAPLASANVTRYMPMTGGRPDIGPLPTWAVFYVLDPSRKAHDILFANADAAGAVPWHVRDQDTGGPISIDAYPTVWLDDRGKAVKGILPRRFSLPATNWQPDDAHQPSLTYLPYLLTGSQYYRDELAMQAGYNLLAVNPEYREQSKGLLLTTLQLRALAWTLRTLANAAYILPRDNPLQGYFQSKLSYNLQEMQRRYVKGEGQPPVGELRGWIWGDYRPEGSVAPWQQDYLMMVLGWTHSMGIAPEARPIMSWATNFVAGRFTNAANGYDPLYGTAYFLYVRQPPEGRYFTTWREAFQATFDPRERVTALDYPEWAGGYAALARASLASIINATGSTQARNAYNYVKAQTPRMEASYPQDPTFAIAIGPP